MQRESVEQEILQAILDGDNRKVNRLTSILARRVGNYARSREKDELLKTESEIKNLQKLLENIIELSKRTHAQLEGILLLTAAILQDREEPTQAVD